MFLLAALRHFSISFSDWEVTSTVYVKSMIDVLNIYLYCLCHTVITLSIYLLCRCDSCGDLCNRVFISHNGPIPLQEEMHMSAPGSKNSETRRQSRVAIQKSDHFTERSHWEPEGIFYLSDGLTCFWPDSVGAEGTDRDRDALSSLSALHNKLSLTTGSTRQEDTDRNSCSFILFALFLLLW